MPTALKISDLPESWTCNKCDREKPRGEMVVMRTKRTRRYWLRPRCKDCQNAINRKTQTDYKNNWQREWRKKNPEQVSCYRQKQMAGPGQKQKARDRAARIYEAKRPALLIQSRLRGTPFSLSIGEAQKALAKFGPLYPTTAGLRPKGRAEYERIRRRSDLSDLEIRIMIYDDSIESPDLVKKISAQRLPQKKNAKKDHLPLDMS